MHCDHVLVVVPTLVTSTINEALLRPVTDAEIQQIVF